MSSFLGTADNDTITTATNSTGGGLPGIGNDTIEGLVGDDLLEGGAGNDSLDGGADLDTASYSGNLVDYAFSLLATGEVTVTDLRGGSPDGADTVIGIETLAFADRSMELLLGTTGNNTLTGAAALAELILGGDGNDSISAGPGNDHAVGESGNDTLAGDSGDDTLSGGLGADHFNMGDGADSIDGGAGISDFVFYTGSTAVRLDFSGAVGLGYGGWAEGDSITGVEQIGLTDFGDTITGGGIGSHLIYNGFGGADSMVGGDGNETFDGGTGDDTLIGGGGNDQIRYVFASTPVLVDLNTNTVSSIEFGNDSFSGMEYATGGTSDDTLIGDGGANTLDGLNGNDLLRGGLGNDSLRGSNGNDTVDYGSDTIGIMADLSANTGSGGLAQGDRYREIEAVIGGTGGDTLNGSDGANTLIGGLGHDTVRGRGGADSLDGGAGTDLLSYETDTIGVNIHLGTGAASGGDAAGDSIAGFEQLLGGTGNDTLVGDGGRNMIDGAAGNDSLDGGGGNDTLDFTGTAGPATIDLGAGTATGPNSGTDSFTGFEAVKGSNTHGDHITGATGNETLAGAAGNDTLIGLDGNDQLDGGLGGDSMVGGAGDDRYIVNSISDVVLELAGGGIDRIIASASLTMSAEVENLSFTGTGNLDVVGNASANRFDGNAGDNRLQGEGGQDTLVGAAGNDRLEGGDDHDRLIGGAGADTLRGDAGFDRLNGGAGADGFHFVSSAHGGDRIEDFAIGLDVVLVSAAGFGGGLAEGALDPARFVANTSGLANAALGQFIWETDAFRLWWDADGTGAGARVMLAQMTGAAGLTADDIFVVV